MQMCLEGDEKDGGLSKQTLWLAVFPPVNCPQVSNAGKGKSYHTTHLSCQQHLFESPNG